MNLIKLSGVMSFMLILTVTSNAEVKSIPVESRISHIILYRSQAMAVREINVPDDTGELALIIDKLPSSIVPGSLFASSKDLKVRSVRYFTEMMPETLPSDKISPLENKIKELNVQKEIISVKQNLQNSKAKYLESLQAQYINKLGPLSIHKADKEPDKTTGFDFDSISKMTDFVFKQQELLTQQNLVLADELRKIDASINETRQQLDALLHGTKSEKGKKAVAPPAQNIIHKAIVYIAKNGSEKGKLSLSYIVNNAGWSPAYNMRIAGEGVKLNLEYIAHVRQLTGEDWNGVALTLSTATPNMNAEIPILAPMWIHLTGGEVNGRIFKTMERLSECDSNPLVANAQAQMGTISRYRQEVAKTMNYNLELNTVAWDKQNIEFQAAKDVLRRWNEGVARIEQQMAVEYNIPDTVTLASRDDSQMVQIFSENLDSNLYYEAVPLLASYISRAVEAKNTINQPLLAGEYSAFIDGQYVGVGQVPVTATGQTLVLGFGIDPQLCCRRELLDKSSEKSWGRRIEKYKYSIVLENYKSVPVNVRLMDRIPVTKDKGIEIVFNDGKDKISTDPDYREFEMPKGILRWDVNIPESSSGSKAFKFAYSFDMKFDSDMQIADSVAQIKEQMRDELNELKKRKEKR